MAQRGLFDSLGSKPTVSIYEVSLRDGLQNERVTVPLQSKLRLVDALVAAGLERIEITSFVSPHWIPQLADADELAHLANLAGPPNQAHPSLAGQGGMREEHAGQAMSRAAHGRPVRFSALCPNPRGLERALAAHMQEIAVFLSASETHNKRNVNKTVAETLAAFHQTIGPAREAGMRVRGYVSTVWGCPYEGPVDARRSIAIAKELIEMGCYQVSLSDTIGAGTPRQTEQILDLALRAIPAEQLAMHMHDTRGTALANVVVGLQMGIRDYDASIGGLGGCPYAPGAAGNLATEDLVYMLDGMGIDTGVNLEKLWEAGRVAESIVGRPLPGKVHQAGVRSLTA